MADMKPQPTVKIEKARRTTCSLGHQLTFENQLVCKTGRILCRTCNRKRVAVLKQQRRAAGMAYMRGCSGEVSRDEIAKIMAALSAGKLLANVIGKYDKDERIISNDRLIAFRFRHPDVFRSMRNLSDTNRNLHRDVVLSSKFILRTNSWMDKEAIPAIQNAVARHIPFFMRDDIRQELMAAVWAGEVEIKDIPLAAKKTLTRQYSSYDLLSKFGHRSLDALMFSDGSRKLIDTISTEARLWA